MRRFIIAIAIIVVVLALLWSGGWWWLAGWADRNATTVLTRIADRGVEVDCQGRDVVGFPFALRIACAETAVAERSSGTRARLAGVTGGASVFAPMTAEIAMASPVRVESPMLEGPAELRWQAAALGIGMGFNGPRDISFDAEDLLAQFALSGLIDPTVAAKRAAGTVAPSTDGGTDATLAFTDLAVSTDRLSLPPVSGMASGHLSIPPRAFLAGRGGLQLPLSARAIDVALDSGGARLEAEGEMSLDAEGVLHGTIILRVAGTEALPAFIAALPPARQNLGNAIAGALLAFGRPAEIDGQPASELVIEIDRGRTRLGVVELDLPRIRL